MTPWKVAESLDRLLAQLNELAPNRSKASDGGIGDPDHAGRGSDHNPWLVLRGQPLVTAFDVTHDPSGGLDCAKLWTALAYGHDPRVKYLIWSRRIMSGASGPSPWISRAYRGPNPHTKHLHLSVVADSRCRDASTWALPGLAGAPSASSGTYCAYGERSDRVMALQRFMTTRFPSYNPYSPTGFYGDATKAGIAEFQRRVGVTGAGADGSIVGPRTLAKLRELGFRP